LRIERGLPAALQCLAEVNPSPTCLPCNLSARAFPGSVSLASLWGSYPPCSDQLLPHLPRTRLQDGAFKVRYEVRGTVPQGEEPTEATNEDGETTADIKGEQEQ